MCTCAAWALIPDDDDEDLVKSAKSRRSAKLKEELGTEKKFTRSEGFMDASLAPVQKAVLELAIVGSQLAAGDLPAVQSTLRWGASQGPGLKELPRCSHGRVCGGTGVLLHGGKRWVGRGKLVGTAPGWCDTCKDGLTYRASLFEKSQRIVRAPMTHEPVWGYQA